MIPKINRLSRLNIIDVKNFGVAKHTSLATYIIHKKNHPTTKVGVVVSKKTLKSAVERNKLKRLVFTLFRKTLGRPTKLHVLVVPKKTATINKTTTISTMGNEIEKLW